MNKNKSSKANMNYTKSTKAVKTTKPINTKNGGKVTRTKKNLATDGYVRPKVTAAEMLTAEQIKERLKNYEKVQKDDLYKLVDGDKVRYFKVEGDGNFKYRPGGFVLVNSAPDYLVLTNNGANWSVQLDDNVIFKAIDIDEIEEKHKIEISDLKRKEEHLYQLLIKQKNLIARLRERINELED